MGIKGSGFGALQQLERRLGSVAKGGARASSKALADGATALARQGFRQGRSPEGATWAPTRAGNPPLRRTGALERAVQARDTGSGFSFSVPSPGGFHQSGTRRMPARPFLPVRGLPVRWLARLRDAALGAIARLFR